MELLRAALDRPNTIAPNVQLYGAGITGLANSIKHSTNFSGTLKMKSAATIEQEMFWAGWHLHNLTTWRRAV